VDCEGGNFAALAVVQNFSLLVSPRLAASHQVNKKITTSHRVLGLSPSDSVLSRRPKKNELLSFITTQPVSVTLQDSE
jgi:hypothetical protein